MNIKGGTKTDNLQWFETTHSCNKLSQWARRVCLNSDGILFVPGIVAGNMTSVFLCASWDGEPIIMDDDGHVFVRADWISQENSDPRLKKSIETLKKKITKVLIKEMQNDQKSTPQAL